MSEQPEAQVPCLTPECDVAEEQTANLKLLVDQYKKEMRRLRFALERHQQLVVMWHGKFALVKHENNVLRRKLRRQDITISPLSAVRLGPPSSDRRRKRD